MVHFRGQQASVLRKLVEVFGGLLKTPVWMWRPWLTCWNLGGNSGGYAQVSEKKGMCPLMTAQGLLEERGDERLEVVNEGLRPFEAIYVRVRDCCVIVVETSFASVPACPVSVDVVLSTRMWSTRTSPKAPTCC